MPYILYHLELVWAFVRGDDKALYGIDATLRGLKLSFLAILVTEPLSFIYAGLFGFFDKLLLFREGGLAYYLLQILLDWGTGPLIFLIFCIQFGYRDRLIPLIVSYNWLSVIILIITLLPGALMTSGLLAVPFAVLLMLAIYGFALWVSFRLYRFVLGCPATMAMGLATLMLIVGMIVSIWLQEFANAQLA